MGTKKDDARVGIALNLTVLAENDFAVEDEGCGGGAAAEALGEHLDQCGAEPLREIFHGRQLRCAVVREDGVIVARDAQLVRDGNPGGLCAFQHTGSEHIVHAENGVELPRPAQRLKRAAAAFHIGAGGADGLLRC